MDSAQSLDLAVVGLAEIDGGRDLGPPFALETRDLGSGGTGRDIEPGAGLEASVGAVAAGELRRGKG
jgi:hypothetical protein